MDQLPRKTGFDWGLLGLFVNSVSNVGLWMTSNKINIELHRLENAVRHVERKGDENYFVAPSQMVGNPKSDASLNAKSNHRVNPPFPVQSPQLVSPPQPPPPPPPLPPPHFPTPPPPPPQLPAASPQLSNSKPKGGREELLNQIKDGGFNLKSAAERVLAPAPVKPQEARTLGDALKESLNTKFRGVQQAEELPQINSNEADSSDWSD